MNDETKNQTPAETSADSDGENFTISSNVPLPPPRTGGRRAGKPRIYPFDQMAVGDALSVKGQKPFLRARNAMVSYQQTCNNRGENVKFVSRAGWIDGQPDQDGGTIWRVE